MPEQPQKKAMHCTCAPLKAQAGAIAGGSREGPAAAVAASAPAPAAAAGAVAAATASACTPAAGAAARGALGAESALTRYEPVRASRLGTQQLSNSQTVAFASVTCAHTLPLVETCMATGPSAASCSRPGNQANTCGTSSRHAARAEQRAGLRTMDPAASGPETVPKALRPQAERTCSGYARVAMRPRPPRANTWTQGQSRGCWRPQPTPAQHPQSNQPDITWAASMGCVSGGCENVAHLKQRAIHKNSDREPCSAEAAGWQRDVPALLQHSGGATR